MSTLYKRANARQAMLLRMVEGAARNAMHAHPGRVLDEKLARSIAKRAAGTVSAAWPALLATPRVSSDRQRDNGDPEAKLDATLGTSSGTALLVSRQRGPMVQAHRKITALCGEAKRAGQTERLAALIEALRIISAEMADQDV